MSKYICKKHGSRTPEQSATMEKIEKDGVCPFCVDFCSGQKPRYHTKPIIKETKWWVLTENFHPYEGSSYHFLLVCKHHTATLDELKTAEIGDAFKLFRWAEKEYKIPGGALLLRFGDPEHTGASVQHLHFQLITGDSRENGGAPILTSLGYQKPKSS